MQSTPQQHIPTNEAGARVHSNVRQITNAIIRRAMKEHSSDIHIIPLEEHSTIRFRVNGKLSEPIRIPISLHEQVISFFRDLATEMHSPKTQEELTQTLRRFEVRVGALSYEMEIEERPSSHGEYIILHVCKNRAKKEAHEEHLSLSGLHQSSRSKVINVLNQKSGVVLLSGPFGSGKTTSMYSFLNYLLTQGKKAISFEKAIEMKIPKVVQIPIGKDVLAFMEEGIFEHVQREQPDVIMIDHIRDTATAGAAFKLSAQGYLVISSIRAVDTSSVLSNLKAFDVSNQTIGNELKLNLCQRLMHRLCSECHKIRPADPATLVRFDLPSDTATFQPHGCSDCMGTGFSGRIPVHETCVISEEFGTLLRSTIPDYEFRQIVINSGMLTLFEDALIKALEGLIPLEEVLRTLPQPTQEHMVGSRLQRMSLLPNNKNLLVSTGDAEAMINQNNPNNPSESVDQQTITQKLKAAESFEDALRTPSQRNIDTLTLTKEDLPKEAVAAPATENVTPFSIKDEPTSLNKAPDSSLLKTLSNQHELTDTVCFNTAGSEAEEDLAPIASFQVAQPKQKQATPPMPQATRQQEYTRQTDTQEQLVTTKMYAQEQPVTAQMNTQEQPVTAQMNTQEQPVTAQMNTQEQPITTQFEQVKMMDSGAFHASETSTQPQIQPSQAKQQAFEASASDFPITTPVHHHQEAAPTPPQQAPFNVSRQAFVAQGFDEQDFDLIQNKTMRFQAARTEPVHSAADVLKQAVHFDAAGMPIVQQAQTPQSNGVQNQASPPFQAQTPDVPPLDQSQSFEQSTATYSGLPQQPQQRQQQRNPQQTQQMPAFQQPAHMDPIQPTQRFQAAMPQALHPSSEAPVAPDTNNNYSQFEIPVQQQPSKQAAPETRKKLLLVEDGHTIRDYISFILRSGGYDVVDVETAEEALSILFHDRPDALISDHILPGMNGTSLIATVRSHPRLCDIPTMLLTSEAKMEVEALRTGADSYLEKPVDPDLLLARLGSLLAAYDRMV